jgi:hypothetical protein
MMWWSFLYSMMMLGNGWLLLNACSASLDEEGLAFDPPNLSLVNITC